MKCQDCNNFERQDGNYDVCHWHPALLSKGLAQEEWSCDGFQKRKKK